MNQPTDRDSAPTLPGQPPTDDRLGGIASTADAGLSDHLQRSAERKDESATGRASVGNAVGGPPRSDLGGTNEPGGAHGGSGPDRRPVAGSSTPPSHDEDRQAAADRTAKAAGRSSRTDTKPDADKQVGEAHNEGPLESLGRAVSEVVTGSVNTEGTTDRRY